jgi:hypothetical protein
MIVMTEKMNMSLLNTNTLSPSLLPKNLFGESSCCDANDVSKIMSAPWPKTELKAAVLGRSNRNEKSGSSAKLRLRMAQKIKGKDKYSDCTGDE